LIDEKEARRSLDVSWKEGIPAHAMLSILDYYLVPYALFLGATSGQIGALIALPHLLASVAQVFAVSVVRSAGSRLRFLVRGTALQAASLAPVAALALLHIPNRIETLVLFILVFRVTGHFIGAAWGSLISDYLPPEKRGHYFGWRSQIIGIAGICAIVVSGALLHAATKAGEAEWGFFLLFGVACACRFASAALMTRMSDVPQQRHPSHDFTFGQFVGRFRESNFVKFTLYVSSITFATQLSGPYFSVYMLRDLQFNYLTFMMIHLAAVLSGLLTFPIWGKHADVVGNAKILKITSFLIPVIPLLWLISASPWWLIAIELFAGFVWGGFNLCATNFIYDAVSAPKRVRCLAYFNLINGCAVFLGAMTGGFLADRLPPLFGRQLFTLFVISAALRGAAHFFLSRHFKEVRISARPISSADLFFSVAGFRPISGLNQEWNVFVGLRRKRE